MFENIPSLIIITSSLIATICAPAKQIEKTISVSYGINTQHYNTFSSLNKSFVDIAVQSKPMQNILGLRYGVSSFYASNGTFLIGAGLGKTFGLKNIDFSLFIYPSFTHIASSDSGEISSMLNFKTTFDVMYYLQKNLKVGIGVMHISNAQISRPNGGIDGLRFTIAKEF
jgi:hypothetical protein